MGGDSKSVPERSVGRGSPGPVPGLIRAADGLHDPGRTRRLAGARVRRIRHHGSVNDSPDPAPARPAEPARSSQPPDDARGAPVAVDDDLIDDDLIEDDLIDDDVEGEVAGGTVVTGRQNRVALLGTIALVAAIAFGGGFATGRATVPAGSPGAVAPLPTPAATLGVELPSDGSRLGKADARVTITYWADFQCPFCARFAQTVIPQLTSRIADGTLAIVHRDYAFIGPESLDAAVAVRCAGREDRFWQMHDAVYAAQSGENKGAFARDRLAADRSVRGSRCHEVRRLHG